MPGGEEEAAMEEGDSNARSIAGFDGDVRFRIVCNMRLEELLIHSCMSQLTATA